MAKKPLESAAPSAEEVREAQLLQTIIPGKILKPPRILIYGVHGIGKSSWAASAINPIFIPTEEGVNEIDVPKFPTATSHADVMAYLRSLYAEKHSYGTVVIDSADWLEDFIRLELQREFSTKELAFGNDSLMAEERLGEVLSALNVLRNKREMASILIAHSEIKKFNSPMTEAYDRYQPKLQQRFSALLQEWADVVIFAGYDVTVKKVEGSGFEKDKHRAVGEGERMLFTEERPAFLAKNRFGMPATLPMLKPDGSTDGSDAGFAEFAQWVPYLREKLDLVDPNAPEAA